VLLSLVTSTSQLECYVCQNQPDNKNKCVETVKTCDFNQDQCLSEVRWRSTPYWSQTDQKQYFISKRCATRLECEEASEDRNRKCDRIWYNDWNCTSCCGGDKCNHFVTLAGYSLNPSELLVLIGTLLTTIYATYQREARDLPLA